VRDSHLQASASEHKKSSVLRPATARIGRDRVLLLLGLCMLCVQIGAAAAAAAAAICFGHREGWCCGK